LGGNGACQAHQQSHSQEVHSHCPSLSEGMRVSREGLVNFQ
jgi:hypothetical protein